MLSEEKRFGKPVYFDQNGRLTTRFQIKHVPAMISQEGLKLIIREIAYENLFPSMDFLLLEFFDIPDGRQSNF